jgi:hypothetical protein
MALPSPALRMLPSKLGTAALCKGYRIENAGTPGRYFLKAADDSFTIGGADVSLAELNDLVRDAVPVRLMAAVFAQDDAIGRLEVQLRMIRLAAIGIEHDPHGGGKLSAGAIADAMIDVEETFAEVKEHWQRAHAALNVSRVSGLKGGAA